VVLSSARLLYYKTTMSGAYYAAKDVVGVSKLPKKGFWSWPIIGRKALKSQPSKLAKCTNSPTTPLLDLSLTFYGPLSVRPCKVRELTFFKNGEGEDRSYKNVPVGKVMPVPVKKEKKDNWMWPDTTVEIPFIDGVSTSWVIDPALYRCQALKISDGKCKKPLDLVVVTGEEPPPEMKKDICGVVCW
jgi:hypothetical protein